MENLINSLLPVLPIRNVLIFPGIALPLRVGRDKSIAAVKQAYEKDGWIICVLQKDGLQSPSSDVKPADLYKVGTLCKIEKLRGSEEEGYQIFVRGVSRVRISEYKDDAGLIEAYGDDHKDVFDTDEKTTKALLQSLKVLGKDILKILPAETEQLAKLIDAIDDLVYLTHVCSGNLEIALPKKQELLEMVSIKGRALYLLELMQSFKDQLQVQSEIRDKLSHRLGQNQREAILREHLRAIKEELGEGDSSPDAEDFDKKIEKAEMPADVEKVAREEYKRLKSLGNQSPETHVIRNYLDLLCAMPWTKKSDSSIDLDKAREILENDHYGLDKIKKRILQHLAVMKLKQDGRGSILLFVGPPGVGKTSLGQSIAKALGRKFVRASLGGLRDDAEIRGHRRTYIGAMPGRIVQGIKRAGENNPVMMLDEIDKLSRSFQGDPASALLEVLDPEQNANFMDHYLDVSFDLSHVFFIATANSLESIPGPLLDRMEVIDLTGYTTAEKMHIAKNHLLPKQLGEHGLSAQQLTINDDTLMHVITHYTREAGVRELQRRIAAICRAKGETVLRAKPEELPIRVQLRELDEILGAERFIHEVAERVVPPGVVTGLAWTPVGGDILFIESSLMPGNGKLTLTGQLGDVMKESAQIALSVVRSHLPVIAAQLDYDKKDLHVHVPAGAIPKDGPSAGIAMLTTIASLFSGRSVSPKLAMTGEITLRGAVMPVGGIKEKVIAAHRAGIERVILPARNQRDLREVPEEVRSQLRFDFVETADQVLKLALGLELHPEPLQWQTAATTNPGPVLGLP